MYESDTEKTLLVLLLLAYAIRVPFYGRSVKINFAVSFRMLFMICIMQSRLKFFALC